MKSISTFQNWKLDIVSPLYPSLKQKSNSLFYWKSYFDIAYYLGVCPFRLEWNHFTNQWEKKENSVQKFLCLLLLLVEGFYFFRIVLIRKNDVTGPMSYFNAVSVVFTFFTIYNARSVYAPWNTKAVLRTFEEIQLTANHNTPKLKINASQHDSEGSPPPKQISGRHEFYLALAGLVGLCIADTILRFPTTFTSKEFSDYREQICKVFFFEKATDVPGWLVYLNVGLDTHRFVTYDFSSLLFFATALFFQDLAQDFVSKMNSSEYSATEVVEHYYDLKKNVARINGVVGLNNFSFTFGALPLYCEIGLFMLNSSPFARKIFIICYIVYHMAGLQIAAQAHKKVREVYDWLYLKSNYTRIPHLELHAFLHDISLNNIGLSSFGSSVVSYSLLGTVLGLAITYTVVLIQFSNTTETK